MQALLLIVGVYSLTVSSSVLTDTQRSIFVPYAAATNRNVSDSVTPQAPTISNNDDWDNEDFVPYNSSRHDEFDWKLIKDLLSNTPNNVIISPFSVKLLMSLLAEAAGKDTGTYLELSQVLPTISAAPQARELYQSILESLNTVSKDYELSVGSKIYVDKSIEPRQRYASIIQTYYSTKIEKIDFNNVEDAANSMNDWVSDITKNHITNLVSKDDIEKSVMIILNALYFNGYWRRPFPLNETFEAPFFVTPTSQTKTIFMGQTASFFYLNSKQLDAKILRLPYKGHKFAMTIVLPNSKGGLDELLHQMDSNTLHLAQYLMDESEVRVQLPKFKFDHTSHLNEVLKRLGITEIFTHEASLPQLARGSAAINRLQVSKILQKAGIDVNEKGSTVFAATDVVLTNKFGGDTTQEFIANRPFVFFIEDESKGTLLFAGKVANPADFV